MPRELAIGGGAARFSAWQSVLLRLLAVSIALLALTFPEWREMAHQWWNIDTYTHVLLVPPILAWLVWLRREDLAKVPPAPWVPGLGWLGMGLLVCLAGRLGELNIVAQAGAVMALQGAIITIVGLRSTLMLAFPLAYAGFLIPFGDELIPALQQVTAHIAVALTYLSGVPAVVDGLYIDTPGGKFVVAEECSGVKFLVAMIALSVLAGWTGFSRWRPRIALVAAAAVVSILANGVRAWGTIFIAQWVGAEQAGGFDHIVYGWAFFAVVIALVLGAAWRHFDREPGEAGLTSAEAVAHPLSRFDCYHMSAAKAVAAIALLALAFAALSALV